MPRESFVTNASHFPVSHMIEPSFLMTRTKLVFVGFVAARNCMRQPVLDDAESLLSCGRSLSQRHATIPTYQRLQSTILQYYEVLLQYFSVQVLPLPRKMTLPHHQILRLSRKIISMADLGHKSKVIYNPQSNRCHPPTSSNTAPATKHGAHHSCSSHVQRYSQ